MYNITQSDKDLENEIKNGRTTLEQNFLKNFSEHERTLELIRNTVILSKTHNLEKNKIIWNTACYVNIVSYDLKIIFKHIAFAENEWEKRYFARQAGLLLYEALNDLLDLLGKNFRTILTKLPNGNLLALDLNEISKSLNEYKKENINTLKDIRNISIGHRDKESLEQLKIIYAISWSEIINYLSSFDRILNAIGLFLEKIMTSGISDDSKVINAHY